MLLLLVLMLMVLVHVLMVLEISPPSTSCSLTSRTSTVFLRTG